MEKQSVVKMIRGCLIVFEGIDGTGKSTQLELLANHLRGQGFDVVQTKEPTEGPYGRKIRSHYTRREKITQEEELALFIEDRRQHVNDLILPALEDNKIILCDRYYLSTIAYQGAAGGDMEEIARRNRFAPEPDLVLLFQNPPELSVKRITATRGDVLNDFEQHDYLTQVAAIFSSMDHSFIRSINAQQSIENVHHDVVVCVERMLPAFLR